jgi:hypothetical protein
MLLQTPAADFRRLTPVIQLEGRDSMTRRYRLAIFLAAALSALASAKTANAQQAYGRAWGTTYTTQDWQRFYHYPYVYYPQNFWGNEYYRSADSLYYRYPPEMRIPVYNRHWHNYYPSPRKFYQGAHFALDVF